MSRPRVSRMLIALAAGTLIGAGAVQAQTTWYVDDDAPNDPGPGDPLVSDPLEDGSAEHPFDAIHEGIDASADGDEVLLVDGTYTGDGNRDLDFGGKAITVRSASGDPALYIIDCHGSEADAHRAFRFDSGEGTCSVLSGFTLTNGYGPDEDVNGVMRPVGGAIYCTGSSPTISDCVASGNSAGFAGGAIFLRNGDAPVVTRCTFTGNWAGYDGGAIISYTNSGPVITDCTFSGNWATYMGGAIYSRFDSSLVLLGCLFIGNCAQQGGASASSGAPRRSPTAPSRATPPPTTAPVFTATATASRRSPIARLRRTTQPTVAARCSAKGVR